MVKNIIFDFGGVIYDIDFKKLAETFVAMGCDDFADLYSQHHADPFFVDFEKGLITKEEFYSKLRTLTHLNFSNDQLKTAWNSILLQYRVSSLGFLTKLASKYNLYLLSNTNQIHYEYFAGQLKNETAFPSLESFFTKTYLSFKIHQRKPGVECYRFVLNDAGINAGETLFIDDTLSNLPGAEEAGIKTLLLLPGEKIEDLSY